MMMMTQTNYVSMYRQVFEKGGRPANNCGFNAREYRICPTTQRIIKYSDYGLPTRFGWKIDRKTNLPRSTRDTKKGLCLSELLTPYAESSI